jgi:hypothetical protein
MDFTEVDCETDLTQDMMPWQAYFIPEQLNTHQPLKEVLP